MTERRTTKNLLKRGRGKRSVDVPALTVVSGHQYKDTTETGVLHQVLTKEEYKKMQEENENPSIEFVDGLDPKEMEKLHKSYEEHTMTPSQYFNLLKGIKKTLQVEEIETVIENAMDAMETFKITGQKSLAENLLRRLELAIKERNAVLHGYTSVINRIDLEVWVHDIYTSNKEKDDASPIRVIEMERYQRPIPEEVIEKLIDAKKYFERFYIVFTDYTGETERQVAKEKRDKDPILFGAFMTETKGGNVRPSSHLFFIADWVDEHCDLTFDQIIKQFKKTKKRDIEIPYEQLTTASKEEWKKFFNMDEDDK